MIRLVAMPVAALLAVAAGATGCGSSSSSSACENVPVGLNNQVASSLSTGFTVDGFQAVKSHDDKGVWFVSARAADPSGGVLYPIWATKDLSDTGTVYAVDGKSRQVAPEMARLPGVSAADDGAAESRDCARKANSKGS
ncbi:MAG: hypothetical protein ACJ77E_16375 [Gaiellaceae bacterium]